MRLSVTSLRRMVKRPLHVEFGPQQLTSYSGLELLRRLRQEELPRRLRAACAATGGDHGGGWLARLVLALLYVGARRLEHLRYVHSTTSLAWSKIDGGMVRPRALAVLRLMESSNFVGCSIGSSPARAPLKILST